VNARELAAGVLLALAAGAVAQAAMPEELRFEQTFLADDGAAPLHYRATYVARGMGHALEVWIDRGARLKRATDAALVVHAERAPGEDEFRLSVLDLRRGIATRVDRTNLYRIGDFTDWFELAQGLRHPRGEYRLARSAAPPGSAQPLQPCDWYALTQGGRTSRICWSAASRLPMLIVSAQGELLWRVTQLDRESIPVQQFEVRDDGYVRSDANQDIEGE
jgi:hypothetical protein